MKISNKYVKDMENYIFSCINPKLENEYIEYLGRKHYKEKQFELITKIYNYLKEKYPEINEVSVIDYYDYAIEEGHKSFKSIIAFIEEQIELENDQDFILDDAYCPTLYCNYEGKWRTIQ